MQGAILGVLMELTQSIISELFADYVSEKLSNSITSLRIETAKKRAMLRLVESLEPMFLGELSTEQTELIVKTLQNILDNTDFTPKLIAEFRFNIDKLAKHYFSSSKIPEEIKAWELDSLLYDMVKQVCIVVVAISNILPEWERVSWQENFRAFDEIWEKLEQQAKLIKQIIDKPEQTIESFERSYLTYISQDLKRIYLKGIGNIGDAKALSLETVYIELRLQKVLVRSDLKKTSETNDYGSYTFEQRKLRNLEEQFNILKALQSSKMIVVIGKPGAGKSTLAQFVALNCAINNLSHLESELNPKLVPFLFKVRGFDDFDYLPTPKKFVALCASMLDSSEAERFAINILNEKRALIIVDGLDECEIVNPIRSAEPALTERDKVLIWLRKLVQAYPGNTILVTSRPVGYTIGMLKEIDFTEYELLPLSQEQQRDFVTKWSESVELSLMPDQKVSALARAEELSQDLLRRISRAKSVQVLVDNPLMLSVVCILHRYRGERLPERKVDLLNDCINVLLYDWRRAHGLSLSIIGDLDARELRSLLEPLAWYMAKVGEQQVTEEILETLFKQYLPELNQSPERAIDILNVIRDRTGVLVEIAPRTYTFAHLLFQEYLAAEECARNQGNYDFLLSKVNDPRWKEIIPMTIASSKGSQETLIRGLLHADAITLAGAAMAMVERMSVSLRDEIVKKMNELPRKLKSNFDTKLLTSLIEIGSSESAQVLIKVMLEFPTISPSEFFEHSAKWDFGEQKDVFIVSLVENAINRCLYSSELDLGNDWGNIRPIGYYNNGITPNRGASWDSFMIGLNIEQENENTQIDRSNLLSSNSVYNYAIILDACDQFRSHLQFSLWPAFEAVFSAHPVKSEKTLLALQLTWYMSDPNEFILPLITFLTKFPREICPSFQLGLLNNAMSRIDSDIAAQIIGTATHLWQEAANELKEQICELLVRWQSDNFFYSVESSETLKSDVVKDIFRDLFDKKLALVQPFETNDAI